MSYADQINRMVTEQRKSEVAALEKLCERMLVTPGSPGISVQRTWSKLSCITLTRLDPQVPFGKIHYLPDVHEDWV